MNALAPVSPISAEVLEIVLGTGNLAQLTAEQRVEYLTSVCRSLGLNPLTRPIRIMSLGNQVVAYATRDCADQLRKLHGISVELVDKRLEDDIFVVTARAKDAGGRTDEDSGAVTLGQLRGEAKANAIMKAITKAKRRVTLSICGLGFLDESEVESIAAAQDEARPPRQGSLPPPAKPKKTVQEWLDEVKLKLMTVNNREELDAVITDPAVHDIASKLSGKGLAAYNDLIKETLAGFSEADDFPGDKPDAT
jgi:hypothetical protein